MAVAGAGGEPEPRVLGLLERGQPAVAALGGAHGPEHLVGVVVVEHRVGDAELDGQPAELAHLVVGAEEEDVDAADHACDGLVGHVGEGGLAEVRERHEGAVPEHVELEVVTRHLVHVLEQLVVPVDEVPGGRGAPDAGHGLDRLEVGKRLELDLAQPVDAVLGLDDPLVVDLVPVRVVLPGALEEDRHALLDLGRIIDRGRADVEVAVDQALVDAAGRRDLPHAREELVEEHPPALGHDRVEGVDRLRVVEPVEEPELALFEVAALVAEEVVLGIQPTPVLGASGRRDVERAREGPRGGLGRH